MSNNGNITFTCYINAIDWISRESPFILEFPVGEEQVYRLVFLWGAELTHRNLVFMEYK